MFICDHWFRTVFYDSHKTEFFFFHKKLICLFIIISYNISITYIEHSPNHTTYSLPPSQIVTAMYFCNICYNMFM